MDLEKFLVSLIAISLKGAQKDDNHHEVAKISTKNTFPFYAQFLEVGKVAERNVFRTTLS